MGVERMGDSFAIAILNHFAKRQERDATLSRGHHGMVERGKSDTTGNGAIDDVLTGVWAFQTRLGLDSLGFGNEPGCELIEVFSILLKREAKRAVLLFYTNIVALAN